MLMFVVHSFMNGICNLLVSVCDLGNLGKQCFFLVVFFVFSPTTFSSVFKDEGLFSLQMFSSAWLKTCCLISFLNLYLKQLFFKKRSEADS